MGNVGIWIDSALVIRAFGIRAQHLRIRHDEELDALSTDQCNMIIYRAASVMLKQRNQLYKGRSIDQLILSSFYLHPYTELYPGELSFTNIILEKSPVSPSLPSPRPMVLASKSHRDLLRTGFY